MLLVGKEGGEVLQLQLGKVELDGAATHLLELEAAQLLAVEVERGLEAAELEKAVGQKAGEELAEEVPLLADQRVEAEDDQPQVHFELDLLAAPLELLGVVVAGHEEVVGEEPETLRRVQQVPVAEQLLVEGLDEVEAPAPVALLLRELFVKVGRPLQVALRRLGRVDQGEAVQDVQRRDQPEALDVVEVEEVDVLACG